MNAVPQYLRSAMHFMFWLEFDHQLGVNTLYINMADAYKAP